MIRSLMELDSNILLWIQNNLRNDIFTPVFIFITKMGDSGAIWLIILTIMFAVKKMRKTAGIALIALIASVIINNIVIKNIVERTRPYEVISGLKLLIEKQSDFSFPSGHTAVSFAVAIVLFKELPLKYGIPALILACLIGFSRLYVGVHYPSDVIGGAIIGICVGVGVHLFFGQTSFKFIK